MRAVVNTGVILAAGAGTRFNGGGIQPKCLAAFDGTPLIELQLRALRECGIDRITVVVGFESDCVREACGPGVRFIENPQLLADVGGVGASLRFALASSS